MEYVTLNNGVKMPMIGYGTYQTPARITEKCVTEAIRLGYRSIDTAQCYGNEKEVGIACRGSGISREELFITTKLWGCHGYQDTLRSIDSSLKRLNMRTMGNTAMRKAISWVIFRSWFPTMKCWAFL